MGRKKPRKVTPQEELVVTYSKHSISSRSTFHPVQWGNGREPADMIIVIGRSVLFVNATAGKSYFPDLCAHNLDQARDRILEWQSGRPIRGENEWRSFAIAWDDIDHIMVISVVDGPHAACIDHPVDKLGMSAKVRLCASLTSAVMRELALRGGGARDLIAFCKSIRGYGKISEDVASGLLAGRYDRLLKEAKASIAKEPKLLGKALIAGKSVSWFDEFRFKFEFIKRDPNEATEVFSDLNWEAIFAAVSFITQSAAEMEGLDRGQIRSAIMGTHAKFEIIVSSSMEEMNKNLSALIDRAKEARCQFSFAVQLTHIGPMETIGILAPQCSWATDEELRALANPSGVGNTLEALEASNPAPLSPDL